MAYLIHLTSILKAYPIHSKSIPNATPNLQFRKNGPKSPLILGWINLEVLRIPGVLQRFAITYFVVASTSVLFMNSTKESDTKIFQDVLCIWPRWIMAGIFLLVHCLLTFCLPIPGCPTGYLGGYS